MKGGENMKEKESFLRLTWKKAIFTLILLGLFLAIGFVCSPSYVDPAAIIYACGGAIDNFFFIPTFWAFNYPIFILFYFILFYFIICLISYLFNKIKRK